MPTQIDYGRMEIGLNVAPEMKRDSAAEVAGRIASYAHGQYSTELAGPRRFLALPIDYGGHAKAMSFLEGPLHDALGPYDIELTCTHPLQQAAELDGHHEYRPIIGGQGLLEPSRPGVIMLLDSSAGTSPCGVTGPSILGGVIWACQQAASIGVDYRPRILATVIWDRGRYGVANFAVRETTGQWLGPKEYIRTRLPNAFQAIGGDNPESPWSGISDHHYASLRGKFSNLPVTAAEACGLGAVDRLLLKFADLC